MGGLVALSCLGHGISFSLVEEGGRPIGMEHLLRSYIEAKRG